jgi:hypothetical protein
MKPRRTTSFILRREIGHSGAIPRGWRMAWYEPRRRVAVYYPPPLHWLARALRELVYRVRLAIHAPPIERAEVFEMYRAHRHRERLADEYARGYLTGWRECFHSCLDAVEEEIARADDVWNIGALLGDSPKAPREN